MLFFLFSSSITVSSIQNNCYTYNASLSPNKRTLLPYCLIDIVWNYIWKLFYATDFLIGQIYRLWFILSKENNFGYKSQSSFQNLICMLLWSSDFYVFGIFGSDYVGLYWKWFKFFIIWPPRELWEPWKLKNVDFWKILQKNCHGRKFTVLTWKPRKNVFSMIFFGWSPSTLWYLLVRNLQFLPSMN